MAILRAVELREQQFLGRTHLVHDNVVDSILLRVLVVAEPDAEALRIKARKVLRLSTTVSQPMPAP